jgi:hypothetical protein
VARYRREVVRRLVDPGRAREVLDGFLRRLDAHDDVETAHALFPDRDTRDKLRESEEGLYHRLPLVRSIVETVAPRLAPDLAADGDWRELRPQVQMAHGMLADTELVTEILGPAGPYLEAGQLHDRVWRAAAPLWEVGHHRHAVLAAAEVTLADLALRIGRADTGTDVAVVDQAWTFGEASPGTTRLRISGAADPVAAQRAAHALGLAVVHRHRCLAAEDGPLDEAVAFETLVHLSAFARLVDEAELVS